MEAIAFCLKAVAKAGDTIAIDGPTYFGIFNIIKHLGLKVIEIPAHPETGIDLEYLENVISKINLAACLFTPNFNNPTGSFLPDLRKKLLIALLAKHELPLIEDDIYGDLYFGKNRPKTCKSFDKKGLVLLCSSVSKSLAPGYRVGWCIPGKFIAKVLDLKMMHNVSSATPTQAAIGVFFENGRYDLHLRSLRKALHTQCMLYQQAITKYFPENIKVSRPQGGYVLWIEMDPSINAFELYQKAMDQKISISPGQIFSTGAAYKNFIRISFGHPYTSEIDKSIRTLADLVRKLSQGQGNKISCLL